MKRAMLKISTHENDYWQATYDRIKNKRAIASS